MNVLLNTPRVQYPPTVNVSSPVARMKQQFDNVGWQLNRLATRVANSRALPFNRLRPIGMNGKVFDR